MSPTLERALKIFDYSEVKLGVNNFLPQIKSYTAAFDKRMDFWYVKTSLISENIIMGDWFWDAPRTPQISKMECFPILLTAVNP